MNVHFVEAPTFTRRLSAYTDDNAYSAFQLALIAQPEQGAVIAGSGGLRKARWGTAVRGKRGALRLIYSWEPRRSRFYLLLVYHKSRQSNLTAGQLRILRRTIEEEIDEKEGL